PVVLIRYKGSSGYPAVSDHNPPAAIDFFGQSAREPLVMPVIMKDLPASVASRHDMVDGA
ncbi:MAG TPA: hypothetical protein VMX74_14680, partial [Pirellulales bacterium]|nr:hypothetical protein [Pirellulales bacterium]